MRKALYSLFSTAFLFLCINSYAQNSSPYWSLAGNSNTTNASILGTLNGTNLNLYTNGTRKVLITTSGNVGIGTGNPLTKLHVNGFGSFGNRVTSANAIRAINLADDNAVLRVLRVDPSNAPAVELISRTSADGSNVAYWDFYAQPSDASFRIRDRKGGGAGLDRVTINGSGNVGIGTISPSYKLHVQNTGTAVYGNSTSGGFGVWGNSTYLGVYGVGASYGVYGYTGSSTSGTGVYGYGNYGVYGSGTYGVYGSGTSYGLYATASDTYGYGVYGSSNYLGVYGYSGSSGSYGTYGYSGYIGAYGYGTTYGVYGSSGSETGVYGYTGGGGTTESGVYGYCGGYGYGLRGYSQNGSGVYATGGAYAGYFTGNVYSTGSYLGSDRKLKKNITDIESGMALINKLKPKAYEFRQDGNYKLMKLPEGKHYGLIAQDLEQVLPNLVKDTKFDTRDEILKSPGKLEAGTAPTKAAAPQSSEIIDFKAVNYTELIPIIIQAMQEQQATIDKQNSKIEALTQLVNNLSLGSHSEAAVKFGASLGQSSPNPNSTSTRISYSIPDNSARAVLIINNEAGQKVKQMQLDKSGLVDINTSGLSNGTYFYTLLVNGISVDTKKMIVNR